MTIDRTIMARLQMVKLLLRDAILQSKAPQPSCYFSILQFHDAVEWLLKLGGLHHQIGKMDTAFMEWWELFERKLGTASVLPYKEQMRALNELRADFKHRVRDPSLATLSETRTNTVKFIQESILIIFSVNFNDISMISLVRSLPARKHLQAANGYWEENKKRDTFEGLALAHAILIREFEQELHDSIGYSPHYFGQEMTFENSFFIFNHFDPIEDALQRKLGSFIDKTQDALEHMRDAVKILSLNLNYRKYCIFNWLTPHVVFDYKDQPLVSFRDNWEEPTEHQFSFCFDYVIDCSLRLDSDRSSLIGL